MVRIYPDTNGIENKKYFRSLCEKYNVPSPKTFYKGGVNVPDLKTGFCPMVVKPVDGSSSKGVTICKHVSQLDEAIKLALDNSESHEIIVEEFVEGDEFTAHYTIASGKVSLSCMDNRYPVALHKGIVTTIPIARVYPSNFLDCYIQKVNTKMIALCESLGIENGVLFVQGIHTPDNQFCVFEAGLRSAGEAPYRFLSKTNDVNYIHLMVDHAILGYSDFDQSKEDPYMNGKTCAIISLATPGGVRVGNIEGIETVVYRLKDVVGFESRYPVGSIPPNGDTLRQLMIRFVLICDNRNHLAENVEFINNNVVVHDVNGNNMCVKFDPKQLLAE